jgi:pimeloyl-ACP methyl ester carboxylesterase
MDYIARHGYDVYLLDLRGDGKSTRPPEMNARPEANPPIVRTETAVKDVAQVVDFILNRRHVSRIVLWGWSWGTAIMASYTAQDPGIGVLGGYRGGHDQKTFSASVSCIRYPLIVYEGMK